MFNYVLLAYLTAMFEQIYVTGLVSAASEITGFPFSGMIYEKFGLRKTYMISLGIASLGGALIIFYGLDHQGSITFPIFFVLCKFVLSSAYSIIVVSNSALFEVEKAATAFSIPTFMAGLSMAASPLIATLEQPIPMYIFCLSSILCGVCSVFLRIPEKP